MALACFGKVIGALEWTNALAGGAPRSRTKTEDRSGNSLAKQRVVEPWAPVSLPLQRLRYDSAAPARGLIAASAARTRGLSSTQMVSYLQRLTRIQSVSRSRWTSGRLSAGSPLSAVGGVSGVDLQCHAVGTIDGHSSLNYWPVSGRTNDALLFDRPLRPKRALRRVIRIATDTK
jgi:hypothetical protein